jgi:hypothetical protein
MGGRAAGTPNKATAAVKTAISDIVEAYLSPADAAKPLKFNLAEDLEAMQPQERAKLITGLAAYIVPKQQALSVEDQSRAEAEALTAWIESAPEEAIDAIAAKILALNAKNSPQPLNN